MNAHVSRWTTSPAPYLSLATFDLQRNRALVLDCLRIRDLGGDWLRHESFDLGGGWLTARDSLIRDWLAAWAEDGICITPRGRREWFEQRRIVVDVLRDAALRAPGKGSYRAPTPSTAAPRWDHDSAAPVRRPRADVTAAICCDPPAGRSALDQRRAGA